MQANYERRYVFSAINTRQKYSIGYEMAFTIFFLYWFKSKAIKLVNASTLLN